MDIDTYKDLPSEPPFPLPEPDRCKAALMASLDVLVEQCGEETVDVLCDLLGVTKEDREKIRQGKCKDLVEVGITDCVKNSIRAMRVYVVCKTLYLMKQGYSLGRALKLAWLEVMAEEGGDED